MPTSNARDLVARYRGGLQSSRQRPQFMPLPAPQSNRNDTPVMFPLTAPRFNAVAGARPSNAIAAVGASHDLPEHLSWAKKAQEERSKIMASLQRAMTMPNTANWKAPTSNAPGGGGQAPGGSFGRFVSAIKGKESGGNYGAVNRSSGALGAYQIMPGNVGPWSREILGRSVSTSEFLRNPKLQDAIALGKLRQYYNKYGPGGAAVAWYAGPGAVAKKMNSTRAQGQYPSINSYMQDILRRMG